VSSLDVFSRSSVTTKLPTYQKPSGAPMSEAEQIQYRKLAFAVVLEAWRKLSRPVNLNEIYWGIIDWRHGIKQGVLVEGVRDRVQDAIEDDVWPFADFPRSKRTVDRRVNESASADFCGGVSWLVCVSPGIYMPNQEFLKRGGSV